MCLSGRQTPLPAEKRQQTTARMTPADTQEASFSDYYRDWPTVNVAGAETRAQERK